MKCDNCGKELAFGPPHKCEKTQRSSESAETVGSVAVDKTLLDYAQDALNRMKRADVRGTGCRLTADMVRGLSVTLIGQIWDEDDPRQ